MVLVVSLLPKVIDALVATLTPLQATITGLHVLDGPDPKDEGPLALFVGMSDPSDPEDLASGSTVMTYAALGQGARNEGGSIPCVVQVTGGGSGLSPLRVAALGVLDAVNTALRTAPQSPWLGVPGLLFGQVSAASLRQAYTEAGPEVQIPFTVSYRARI